MIRGVYRIATGIIANGVINNAGTEVTIPANGARQQSVEYGTGASQFTILVRQSVSLLPGQVATYDLFTGTDLKDINNESATFRNIKSFAVWIAANGGPEGVKIGGGGSPWSWFFTDFTIYPGGPATPYGSAVGGPVTSANKNLRLENLSLSTPVTVFIEIAGTVAVPGSPMGLLLALTYP